MNIKNIAAGLLTIGTLLSLSTSAQTADQPAKKKKNRTGSFYVSWGYNSAWYTRSTVHVTQREIQNDYQLVQVNAHDHKGWNEKSIFRQPITIPQYNYRIGYYFNKKQDLAFEINFDHTKYIIADNQYMRVKGIMNNAPVDETILFSEQNGFYYFLNNGANFLLFNIVKRYGLYHTPDRSIAIDLTGKAGIGPVIPHVENKLFGRTNDMGFQLGGWNTGLETALRVTVMKYGFVEFSQKVDYARYSHLKVAANGTARQAFGTYELILSAGFILPTTRHNPLFEGNHVADNAAQ
jgi:hypothetical protein